VCGAAAAAAGWGRLQQQRPHRHAITSKKQMFIRVRPLPPSTFQNTPWGGMLRLSRTVLSEAPAKRKILVRAKFAFYSKNTMSVAEILQTKAILPQIL